MGTPGKLLWHQSGTETNEISNRQRLQSGMIELLQKSNVALANVKNATTEKGDDGKGVGSLFSFALDDRGRALSLQAQVASRCRSSNLRHRKVGLAAHSIVDHPTPMLCPRR